MIEATRQQLSKCTEKQDRSDRLCRLQVGIGVRSCFHVLPTARKTNNNEAAILISNRSSSNEFGKFK